MKRRGCPEGYPRILLCTRKKYDKISEKVGRKEIVEKGDSYEN